ncbi:hypothetical protein Taro_002448 [Colocasia esculenta]|uniref:Uncharacterized protein n=1 Tax=Colocasia esculenta TaxID=4460 RepID=A0A843TJ57_COLES|nr:hypothetical protein [Colocasia esculenta]
MNGYKFEIDSIDSARVTQNSGIVTIGDYGTAFYGVLKNIFELHFGIKLKEWRCELKKKRYMKGENEELSIEPPEQRITRATWDSLVDYWGTDENVREFERNKKNHAHEQASHTLGAKSIARHNQEQEKVIEVC